MHHMALTRCVLKRQVYLFVQSKTFANLIDPELEPEVQTTERFLLQDPHCVFSGIAICNVLPPLLEVRIFHVEEVLPKHVSSEFNPM
jgi:hypothetical protein